ncbi:MAG: methyltransferase, partial [Promethearchaeota archaeon]
VLWGNLYEPLEKIAKFDSIVSNPPQAAGKFICSQLIREAPHHLKKHGLLQIVGRQRKGGKFYMREMEECFGNVEITLRKSGYSIYVAVKQD